MTTIERSALLPYAAEQIFALVADIERYPEFLDGCVGAEILEQGDNTVTASLKLSRAGISHGFTPQLGAASRGLEVWLNRRGALSTATVSR